MFLSELESLPPLRPGVREGLTALRKSHSIIFVITEGERDRVRRTARAHQLEGLFDRIIEAPKIPRIYQRALRLVGDASTARSEEHTSELQSLMRISYAVFCLKKKTMTHTIERYTFMCHVI